MGSQRQKDSKMMDLKIGAIPACVSPPHHFGDKADYGRGRLVRIQLGKQVADIVCCASLFPRHEAKKPERKQMCVCALLYTCTQWTQVLIKVPT